jgi:agmatinase
VLLPIVYAQQHTFETKQQEPWTTKYGTQTDLGYTGPLSYSHLPYTRCLDDSSTTFDIAVLGMPFDTATSYRPGARFGPFAIRSGSRRQFAAGGYALEWMMNPYTRAEVIDCGDVSFGLS